MTEISRELENYILEHSDPEDVLLHELNRYTHLNVVHPRMLSGTNQGQMLKMFSYMLKPKYILELGTFTGYSAICLSQGLQPNGKLFTIENNDEIAEIAQKFFIKSKLTDKIELHIGDARTIIPQLNYMFDLVFMDAEKSEYIEYYELVFDKLIPGGFILADNVLWSGKVLTQERNNDHFTKGIKNFNDFVKNDQRVEKTIFPLRDGLMLIRKK
jgi:caffeoyl-CoA O-methyltransferase